MRNALQGQHLTAQIQEFYCTRGQMYTLLTTSTCYQLFHKTHGPIQNCGGNLRDPDNAKLDAADPI